MVSSKHAFWMALVFTIIVFIVGMIFGYFLEINRSDNIQLDLMKSEITLLDEQIKNKQIISSGVSCDLAQASVFDFADRIYLEAQQMEKYDATSKFVVTLKIVHKRYDLLRMMVWDESMYLKRNCSSDFHTVVYFFNYDEKDLDIRAEQSAFSKVLIDVKNAHSDQIILIPVAANLDLGSVNLAMEQYHVKKAPAILIDEKIVIDGIPSASEIENAVFENNKTRLK